MFGRKPTQLVGPRQQLRLGSTRSSTGQQRTRFAVPLHEPADEGRADRETFGYLGRRFSSLAGLEDPNPQVQRNGRHAEIRKADEQGVR
jgi:hypothetical protein